MSEFRKRVLEPLSLPLGAAVLIAIMVFSASRILLAVEEAASTIIAFVIAAEVLGVAAVIAVGTRLKKVQRVLMGVIGLSLIGGGAAAAEIGVRHIEKHGVEVVIVAKNVAFTQSEVPFPPDNEFTLKFVNEDAGVPHNVHVFEDEARTKSVISTGSPISTGSQAVETTLKSQDYTFICDVHPNMVGTLVPEAGAGGHGGTPTEEPHESPTPSPSPSPSASAVPSASPSTPPAGAPTTTDVSAQGLAFNVSEFTLAAGVADTIHFDNQEAQLHNISIYANEDFSGDPVYRGEFVQGPKKITYTFTGPAAGTYYFKCDAHPAMKGKAIFK